MMRFVRSHRLSPCVGTLLLVQCGVFSDPEPSQEGTGSSTGTPAETGGADTDTNPGETQGTQETGGTTGADTTTGESGPSGSDDDGSDESGDVLPSVGVRVFPRFMLEPLPAVVTLDAGPEPDPDIPPIMCLFDDEGGGYLCPTETLEGPDAQISVEREGFEPAARTVAWEPEAIVPIDVHLMVEGSSGGVWSECVGLETVETCSAVCEAQTSTCSPASCLTGDDDNPLATVSLFSSADCSDVPLADLAAACQPWEVETTQDAIAVRCCCVE